MELGPGTILAGKYRYDHELGAGGMGRVVAATHVVLRQRVALKVLALTKSPQAVQRFLREARLAFRLTSPHVTKVLDAGELEDGIPYIAMELLEGVDLAKLAKERGALPVVEACDYVLQACAGIGEAHALGIVHRDIKLANLFLVSTPRGPFVKVLDFGCAKAERTGATSIAYATEDGAWLGTPRCMAPEQLVSSRDVDARTDVWALGVVLYTLLAGRPPFDGKTLRVFYEQIQLHPPPPIARPLPKGLAAIIDRCLQKLPEKRFADARALADALAPFAKLRHARRAKYLLVALAALASTAIGASVVGFELHRDRQPTPSATPIGAESVSVATTSEPVTTTLVSEAPANVDGVPSVVPHTVASSPRRDDHTVNIDDVNAAEKFAQGFCARPHVRACFTWTTEFCVTQTQGWDLACWHSNDREACMSKLLRAQSQDKRVRSKACADFAD